MKQFSTVLNIVLLVAVGVLYYLHFSSGTKSPRNTNQVGAVVSDSAAHVRNIIAYVELDSIKSNVAFIKRKEDELEAEQKQILSEYEAAYRNLEAEKNNFVKKGNAITQKEAEDFQALLTRKQQQIEENKQVKGQKLAEKGAKIMEEMQAKLKDFLHTYNKEKKFTYILATGTGLDYLFYKDSTLDITPEIVNGLNEKMQ